jgi:hypothetical protein
MRTRLMRGKFLLLFMTFGIMLAIPAIAFAQDVTGTTSLVVPTMQSDKADYAPGELVTLTGSGWQPGESVNIVVNDDEGQTWNRNVNVIADASGNISDSFNLPDWFVAAYSVKATGASGAVATTSFTDGNVNVKANLTGTETWTLVDGARNNSSSNCSPESNRQSASVQSNVTLTGSNQLASAFGANANQTVRLTASPSSSGGKTFDTWTDPSGNAVPAWDNPSTTAVETDKKVICVSGFIGSGTNVYTANYVDSTTLNVDPASGTYGGTTNLSAKLTKTSGGTGVVGKPTTFKLKGSSVGTATTVADDPSTPSVNEAGTATLNGASLSGIGAGTYLGSATPPGVSASFAGDSGFSMSSGSNTLTVSQKNLTINGAVANDKPYDGNSNATVDFSGANLSGVVSGDTVTINSSAYSASFDNSDVGTNKPVTVTGVTLGGAQAGNYSLNPLVLSANITAWTFTGFYQPVDMASGTPSRLAPQSR